MTRLPSIVAAGLCLLALAALPARGQEAAGSQPPPDKDALHETMRDFILENPEVLVEALSRYQRQQELEARQQPSERVAAHRDALFKDPRSPVIGNLDGDVVIVEFFDYNCPYCRSTAAELRQAIAEDGQIQLIMMEFPILGEASRWAARASLAAARQGLYEDYHFALMADTGPYTPDRLIRIAESVGLDTVRLQQDLHDPDITTLLRDTYDLARKLQINGTPAFVVGDQLHPGALDMGTLRALVAQQRAHSS